MSVTKTKATQYHETDQSVKFRIDWIRINGLENLQSMRITGSLSGKVGTAPGEVDSKVSSIGFAEIQANCTATERGKIRSAIAIFERELARVDDELTGESHDNTDVFVEPS